ncbi:hypothetical protein KGF70_16935 [Lactiplantibacillus sp. 7.2.4]|nr:hypothetical protein [Lactiplantibacillus sp. 7.2.4]
MKRQNITLSPLKQLSVKGDARLMDAHKIDLKKLNKDKQKAFDIFGKYGSFATLYREGTEADIHFVDNYISLAAVYEQRKLVGLE